MAFIRGTSRPDRLNGTDDSDFILAFAGDDVVFAGAGNDYVDAGLGDDHVDGGDGNDMLIGGLGNDVLEGGGGDDVLVDLLVGGYAEDVSYPYPGGLPLSDDDVMNGGDGDDVLVSAVGNDIMDGGDGNDTFLIGTGSKIVIGGAGDDHMTVGLLSNNTGAAVPDVGGSRPPSVFFDGGDGNDSLVVSGLFAGNLTFIGGAGDDIVVSVIGFASNNAGVMEQLNHIAEAGSSSLFGGDGNDFLTGGFLNDLLFGEQDSDTLIGGSGDDKINGGPGGDTLTGGLGEDKFIFAAPGDGVDVLTDFTPGVDQVWVDADSFGGGLAPGALAADQFVAGSDPVAMSGTGVFLYDTDDGTLSWDADGAGGNASVAIAVLLNQPALSASDFLVV